MENVEYGWGVGSVVAMLLVVGCLLFLPLGMGPVLTPPSIPVIVLVPVFLVVVIIFLSVASDPNR
ncbi:hypothetical protein Hdeb2414_s0009g00309961 [Helianthus debilis subsp. tardiflorus]